SAVSSTGSAHRGQAESRISPKRLTVAVSVSSSHTDALRGSPSDTACSTRGAVSAATWRPGTAGAAARTPRGSSRAARSTGGRHTVHLRSRQPGQGPGAPGVAATTTLAPYRRTLARTGPSPPSSGTVAAASWPGTPRTATSIVPGTPLRRSAIIRPNTAAGLRAPDAAAGVVIVVIGHLSSRRAGGGG